jgi:hypothetical protein
VTAAVLMVAIKWARCIYTSKDTTVSFRGIFKLSFKTIISFSTIRITKIRKLCLIKQRISEMCTYDKNYLYIYIYIYVFIY